MALFITVSAPAEGVFGGAPTTRCIRTPSAVEGKVCKAAGGTKPAMYVIGCGIYGVGVSKGDSLATGEGLDRWPLIRPRYKGIRCLGTSQRCRRTKGVRGVGGEGKMATLGSASPTHKAGAGGGLRWERGLDLCNIRYGEKECIPFVGAREVVG